MTYSR